VFSSHWLSDPAWPRAVVLEALPLLTGPPLAVSGYWFPTVQGCPRSSLLGCPSAVYPIPGACQAGPLAVAAEAGSLLSLDGWVGLLAVLAGPVSFRWVRPGAGWSAGVWAVSADAQVASCLRRSPLLDTRYSLVGPFCPSLSSPCGRSIPRRNINSSLSSSPCCSRSCPVLSRAGGSPCRSCPAGPVLSRAGGSG
jgi:hypothetical protein